MSSLKIIFKYLKEYKKYLIIVFILSIIYSVLYVLSPKILSMATNKIVHTFNNIDFKYICFILIICLIIYIVNSILKYINSIIINKICNNISYNLRKKIIIKINKLKMEYIDNTSTGEILSKINNDVSIISNNLEQILTDIITAIICFIGIFIMMLSISKLMTIIIIILIPIQLFLMTIIVLKSQKYFNKRQEIVSNINDDILNMVTKHQFIKINNLEKKESNKFVKTNDNYYKCCFKSDFLSSIMFPIISFTNNISYIVTSLVGGFLVLDGKIRIGDIQAFLQYIQKFNENSESISTLSNSFQLVIASINNIEKFLSASEEDTKSGVDIELISGKIEFKNVYFSYNNKDNVIKNFNIKINKGQTVAIVGHTGCGKTTLTNILLKYYEGYKGRILIDGKDLRNINMRQLRKRVGYIEQNCWVFNGSVIENIIYGGKNNLKNIYNQFNLDEYIDNDLIINEEGGNISIGEKQIIGIFRTFMKDSDIIILDEATSNIDSRTELLIQKIIKFVTKDKTSIIIAHRLSTIKNADLILVMDNGRLCEVGTHKELLKLNGKYKKLYDNSI